MRDSRDALIYGCGCLLLPKRTGCTSTLGVSVFAIEAIGRVGLETGSSILKLVLADLRANARTVLTGSFGGELWLVLGETHHIKLDDAGTIAFPGSRRSELELAIRAREA